MLLFQFKPFPTNINKTYHIPFSLAISVSKSVHAFELDEDEKFRGSDLWEELKSFASLSLGSSLGSSNNREYGFLILVDRTDAEGIFGCFWLMSKESCFVLLNLSFRWVMV